MRHLARWSLLLTVVLFFHSWILEQFAWVTEGSAVVGATLWRALGGLVGIPSILAFALFSRIDESKALEHASRQRLRDAIRSSPGVSLSELCEKVGLGWGTTVYHLNRMEGAGLIASDEVGRRRAFFLTEHGPRVRDMARLMANAAQMRLLQALRGRRNPSQQELAAAAGLSLSLAHRYLKQLEQAGLVRSDKHWRVRTYEPTQRLQDQWDEEGEREKSATAGGPLSVLPTLSSRETNAP